MSHLEVCLKTKQNGKEKKSKKREKKKKRSESNHPEMALNLSPETIIFRITAQLCFNTLLSRD